MELKGQQMQKDSKTGFTLEDFIRMGFHPKGVREFMEEMNYELELGPTQSSINKKMGIFWDITKYIAYADIVYEIFK